MLVLTDGTLIDGTGCKPIQNAIVIIKGNCIDHGQDYCKRVVDGTT